MMMQAKPYEMKTSPLPVVVNARWAERVLLTAILVVVDLLMVLLGFWLAYYVRFDTGFFLFYQHEVSQLDFYQRLVFLFAPLWVIVFGVFGLYNFKNLFSGTKEYSQAFNATTLGMMLIILFTFFQPELIIARAWVTLSWLLVGLCVALGRFAMRRMVQHMRLNGRFLTSVLIIGANEEGQAIAEQLQSNRRAGIWIAGFVDDTLEPGSEPLPHTPVVGSVDSLRMTVRQYGIQEIIIASTALPRQKLLGIFQTFGADDSINIRMSSGLYELLTTGVEVQDVGNVPLLSINRARLTGADQFMKGVLDLLVSGIFMFLLWPVMVMIALAIKFDSSGPVIYRRRVIGVGGKPFHAFKFRTMYTDADERLARDPELSRQFEQNFKLKDDPRVTKVGRLLRQTSLDELPQLFNVLFGQMSLVGPRMITEQELDRYGKWQMNLSTVKPGITGLWQVSGRSDVSYEERVMLDMNYIRNYNIWSDLFLLWQTIPAVLKRRGAY